jgi:4-aminobutyrate aminotransferase-like enzyme
LGDASDMITAGKQDIDLTGDALPVLRTAVPGPASLAWLQRLEATECPGSTVRRVLRDGRTRRPSILWSEALGSNVADVDGNIYVDLCAGFGVASIGHRHPAVVTAGKAQLDRLPHAMGDAFADVRRVMLMEALSRLTGMPRVMLVTSGSEAVEVAMKTAVLATGRQTIVAFHGAYHGLSVAPLAALGHQVEQRQGPFRAMLGGAVTLAPFGGALPDLSDVAAVLVEPVQGRGGMRAPPPGWLAGLHAAARSAGALVIHDEIYCGLGRTGTLFAGSAELDSAGKPLSPDLLCVGKALGGGFPISACLGTDAAMATWASNPGALHTQTFLGNPIGCAMALASLDVITSEGLTARAAEQGARWAEALAGVRGVRGVTGRGLMLGVVVDDAPAVTARMLQRGWLVLPCGEHNEAIGLTPPLTISPALLDGAVAALAACIG